jgi:hypothetical protein
MKQGYRTGDRVRGNYQGVHPYVGTVLASAESTEGYQLVRVQLDQAIILPWRRSGNYVTVSSDDLTKA